MVRREVKLFILALLFTTLIWISGYLFAGGLLLSWPHNPLWVLPSLVFMILSLIVAFFYDTMKMKEEP